MKELKKHFPPGVDAKIIYDPNIFIAKSIKEVVVTIFVAILLVVGVVFLFLQSWRATIIPCVAIPVSLVGAFTILFFLVIPLPPRSTLFPYTTLCAASMQISAP